MIEDGCGVYSFCSIHFTFFFDTTYEHGEVGKKVLNGHADRETNRWTDTQRDAGEKKASEMVDTDLVTGGVQSMAVSRLTREITPKCIVDL